MEVSRQENILALSTGVSSLSLLQGIFPIQRSNPDLLHCRQIPYRLSHQESPRHQKHIYQNENISEFNHIEINNSSSGIKKRKQIVATCSTNSSIQLLSRVRLFATEHARPPCPSPTSGVHSNSRPLIR